MTDKYYSWESRCVRANNEVPTIIIYISIEGYVLPPEESFFQSGIVFNQKGALQVGDYEAGIATYDDNGNEIPVEEFYIIVEEEHQESFLGWLNSQGFIAI